MAQRRWLKGKQTILNLRAHRFHFTILTFNWLRSGNIVVLELPVPKPQRYHRENKIQRTCAVAEQKMKWLRALLVTAVHNCLCLALQCL
jgi:hypothetical protein